METRPPSPHANYLCIRRKRRYSLCCGLFHILTEVSLGYDSLGYDCTLTEDSGTAVMWKVGLVDFLSNILQLAVTLKTTDPQRFLMKTDLATFIEVVLSSVIFSLSLNYWPGWCYLTCLLLTDTGCLSKFCLFWQNGEWHLYPLGSANNLYNIQEKIKGIEKW